MLVCDFEHSGGATLIFDTELVGVNEKSLSEEKSDSEL